MAEQGAAPVSEAAPSEEKTAPDMPAKRRGRPKKTQAEAPVSAEPPMAEQGAAPVSEAPKTE